jgi:hypothetical protein
MPWHCSYTNFTTVNIGHPHQSVGPTGHRVHLVSDSLVRLGCHGVPLLTSCPLTYGIAVLRRSTRDLSL